MLNLKEEIIQRIRRDRKAGSGTWLAANESHLVLNVLEREEQLEEEKNALYNELSNSISFPCKNGDTIYWVTNHSGTTRVKSFVVSSLEYDRYRGKILHVEGGAYFYADDEGLCFSPEEVNRYLNLDKC